MKEGNVFTNYIKESFQELHKVTWPTKNRAVRMTIIVLVFTLISALILGVIDFAFNELYDYALRLRS